MARLGADHIVISGFATVVMASSILPIVLTIGASRVAAQETSKRQVHVTVTDSHGRLVSGLDRQHFEVVENGARRAITDLSPVDAAISVALVGEQPFVPVVRLGPRDEFIQTPSLSDALRLLAASENPRRVILTTANTDLQAIPPSIQPLQINPANLPEVVTELRRQYQIEFESAAPSANVEVVLNQPRGLHDLKLE